MRPTSVARWGLPAAAAGGRRRRRANTAAVEKIEGSVSLKIFSGTARRREAITRRSLVQILPPQPHCATKKDVAPENPEAATVSGVFRVHF